MSVEAKINLYGSYETIDIDYSQQVQFTNRLDGTNKIGGLAFYSSRKYNIPTFTPCIIKENSEQTFWFASSESSKILNKENLYFHSLKLTDGVEILKCYFLGAKSFSVNGTNKYDYEKLNVIKELVKVKYGINLVYKDTTMFNATQTLSFGENDTIYNMFTTLCNLYKYSFIVTNASNKTINIEFLPQSNTDTSTFELVDERVLNVVYSANDDLFCDNLETSINNVVDRTNPQNYKGLVVKSNEDVITYDNCKLLLPCNIEQIKKVDIYTEYGKGYFRLCLTAPTSYFTNVTLNSKYTYNELRALNASLANLALMMIDCAKNVGNIEISTNTKQFYVNKNYIWLVKNDTTTNSLLEIEKATITTQILEKSQFDLLSSTISNKYLYYEQGKNYIANFQGGKNKGIINDILGISTKDFLVTLTQSIKNYLMLPSGCGYYKDADGDEQVYLSLLKSYQTTITGSDTSEVMFDVTCIPYTNLYLINNEKRSGFEIARPYNATTQTADIDKVVPMLDRIKKQMGVRECTITYNVKNHKNKEKYFALFKKIKYDDDIYYIQSIQKQFDSSDDIYILSLTSEPMVYAYDINIDNRFEALNNPTNNIIDRNIHYSINITQAQANELLSGNVFMYFGFYDSNEDTIEYLMGRATTQYADNRIILSYETNDYYCFDTCYAENSGSKVMLKNVPYVDKFNECKSVYIRFVKVENITMTQAKKFPYPTTFKSIDVPTIVENNIYKDARERLIFTIEGIIQ